MIETDTTEHLERSKTSCLTSTASDVDVQALNLAMFSEFSPAYFVRTFSSTSFSKERQWPSVALVAYFSKFADGGTRWARDKIVQITATRGR